MVVGHIKCAGLETEYLLAHVAQITFRQYKNMVSSLQRLAHRFGNHFESQRIIRNGECP